MKAHFSLRRNKNTSADTNIDGFMSFIGASGSSSTLNYGRMFMRLKPMSERKLNVDQIIQELRPKLAKLTGFNVFPQNPAAWSVPGRIWFQCRTNTPYRMTDTKELFFTGRP